jgi:hypothetical protein
VISARKLQFLVIDFSDNYTGFRSPSQRRTAHLRHAPDGH